MRNEYQLLLRDRMISETALIAATEQLEVVRGDAARETSTFQILDPPKEADRPARPRLALVSLAAALVGMLGSMMFEWNRSESSAAKAPERARDS